MHLLKRGRWLACIASMILVATAARSQAGPDILGIRPGMSPQDAYNILKSLANGAKIGLGQTILKGVSDKPVVVIMSVQPVAASPKEVISVWLTTPPNRQVVWAVRRTLTFESGKEMLRSDILDGLHQKYGPETDPRLHVWSFNGGALTAASEQLRRSGCATAGLANLPDPIDPTNPQPITPLYSLMHPDACAPATGVRAEFFGVMLAPELAGGVTVSLSDMPLALQSLDAYKAFNANAADAKHQQDIDQAKQQKKIQY